MRLKGTACRILLLVAVALLSAGSASFGLANESDVSSRDARTGFKWIGREDNRPLWSKVEEAFRQELSPDTAAPGSHKMAHGYKYVFRIGVHKDWALVLIGQRVDKSYPPEIDSFLAYTWDIRTSRKSEVMPLNEFVVWRFVGLARFDQSPVPEVVFTQDDCVECETRSYLSSFYFNSKDKEWKLRVWPHDGTDLFIGGAIRDEPPHTQESVCLYSLRDFNGDRLDDIAIWCRERNIIRGAEKDSVFLYTMRGDTPARIAPEDSLLKTIKSELCHATPDNPLCSAGR